MKNSLHYKGYSGTIEYSEEDELYYGKVTEVRSSISYEGNNIQELSKDFEETINVYLEICDKAEPRSNDS